MSFADDIHAQPDVLRGVARAYAAGQAGALATAVRHVHDAGDRPVLVLGMGSSLSAGRSLVGATATTVVTEDAGEHLHFGLGTTRSYGAVITISQSGRSFETVAVLERLRAGDAPVPPVIALVNDPDSPLGRAADVVLPLLAGTESPVASRTFTASVAVLALLAEGGATPGVVADVHATADAMERLVALDGEGLAAHFADAPAYVLVGRGPGLAAAHYGALTVKESAAIPAEAMTGGAFRHGPVELFGSPVGIGVVAPGGPASELGVALAREAAGSGSRTWLLTTDAAAVEPVDGLLVTALPAVRPALASLAAIVPFQLLAATLATRAGRTPGQTRIAGKVTDRE